jgi:hypothetical protein
LTIRRPSARSTPLSQMPATASDTGRKPNPPAARIPRCRARHWLPACARGHN